MLACMWLVECLTTALNNSSSHHSSCVRGSSGSSMRVSVLSQYSSASRFKRFKHACVCAVSILSGSSGSSMCVSVLFQYSTASRFKLEHAVSVLLSPLKNVCCATHFHMHRVHHGGCGHLGSLSVSCDIRGSRCITRWQRMMMRMKPKPPIANETEATYSE